MECGGYNQECMRKVDGSESVVRKAIEWIEYDAAIMMR